MPSETSNVGATALPIPAGATGAKLTDPFIESLLTIVAWYLKDSLDAKLAKHTGTSTDAVPTANRFSFDPTEPRGHSVKLPVPALFIWWDELSVMNEWTTVYKVRDRFIHLLYAYNELPAMAEMVRRSGLMNAVDSTLHKLSARKGQHPDYSDGFTLDQILGARGDIDWRWLGGMPGRFGVGKDADYQNDTRAQTGRDWPALRGRFMLREKILLQTLEDPADVNRDVLVTIKASDGSTTETMDYMQRYLTAPDGADSL